MVLVPGRVEHRREFYGRAHGEAKGGRAIALGKYGLEAVELHWITDRQIEAARIAMTRFMEYGERAWIRIFPQKSYTAKDVGVRMNSGKDAPVDRVAVVKRGKIMFEIGGVPEDVVRGASRLASDKLPVKTKFVKRSSGTGGESNEC